MMQSASAQVEIVRGAVESTNAKGVKVDGRWFNYSQFSGPIQPPGVGDEVEMEVAKGRFINRLTTLGGNGGGAADALGDDDAMDGDAFDGLDLATAPAVGSGATAPSTRASARSASPPAPASYRSPSVGPDSRNQEIRRLALVKAAAEYAAERTDLTPEHVISIASQWEAWVTGSTETGEHS